MFLKEGWAGKNDGSTLVGAVVISLIMAIGIAGLIGVSRNTLSQEVDAHNEVRAFLAAESGLNMLENWVMQDTTGLLNSTAARGVSVGQRLGEQRVLQNSEGNNFPFLGAGETVTIEIVKVHAPLNPDSSHTWSLRSTADFGGERGLAYKKLLARNVMMVVDSGGTPVFPTNPGPTDVIHESGNLELCVPPEGITVWIRIPNIGSNPGLGHTCWLLENQGTCNCYRLGAVYSFAMNESNYHCNAPGGQNPFGGNGQAVVGDGPFQDNGSVQTNGNTARDFLEISWVGGRSNGYHNQLPGIQSNGNPRPDNQATNECKPRTFGKESNTTGLSLPHTFLPRRGDYIGPIRFNSKMPTQSVRVMIAHTGGANDEQLQTVTCEDGGDPITTTVMGRWNETNTAR